MISEENIELMETIKANLTEFRYADDFEDMWGMSWMEFNETMSVILREFNEKFSIWAFDVRKEMKK